MVSLDTPGTQGVVGFVGTRSVELSNIIISDVRTPFVNSLFGSLTRDRLPQSQHMLLTTLERWRYRGMRYNEDGSEVLNVGNEPMLLKPVQATILIKRREIRAVHVLDEQGRRTAQTIPTVQTPEGCKVHLDGSYEAFWFEIVGITGDV